MAGQRAFGDDILILVGISQEAEWRRSGGGRVVSNMTSSECGLPQEPNLHSFGPADCKSHSYFLPVSGKYSRYKVTCYITVLSTEIRKLSELSWEATRDNLFMM